MVRPQRRHQWRRRKKEKAASHTRHVTTVASIGAGAPWPRPTPATQPLPGKGCVGIDWGFGMRYFFENKLLLVFDF